MSLSSQVRQNRAILCRCDSLAEHLATCEPFECAHCGAQDDSVRRDHDNVPRCDACYANRYPTTIHESHIIRGEN